MRPAARLAAIVELLDLIEFDDRPADMIVRDFFRIRRYAGSGDRRAITGRVYDIVRARGLLDWRLLSAEVELSNRMRLLLFLAQQGEQPEFEGAHALPPQTEAEVAQVIRASAFDEGTAPPAARLGHPEWLSPMILDPLGGSEENVSATLSGRAAVDLRVNSVLVDRDVVLAALNDAGISAQPHRFAPHGVRMISETRLESHDLLRSGKIEIQDAGSQYVGHIVGARPGMRVADVCAGAGGKTLLLAADMQNQGELFASDIDGRRLKRLNDRAGRAGTSIVTTWQLGADMPWPEGWDRTMDRVLVDAPCSGSGTWRRQPEQRWRLTPERITELQGIQRSVLAKAARLVAPGGRMIYVTCSFLAPENETAVTDFLNNNPDFSLVPWTNAAREASLSLPSDGMIQDAMLRLSPFDHGVDSFFAAVMTRTLG